MNRTFGWLTEKLYALPVFVLLAIVGLIVEDSLTIKPLAFVVVAFAAIIGVVTAFLIQPRRLDQLPNVLGSYNRRRTVVIVVMVLLFYLCWQLLGQPTARLASRWNLLADEPLNNRYVIASHIAVEDKDAWLFEFGVSHAETDGLWVDLVLTQAQSGARAGFAPSVGEKISAVPMFRNPAHWNPIDCDVWYGRKTDAENITPGKSFWIYVEFEKPAAVRDCRYTDYKGGVFRSCTSGGLRLVSVPLVGN